MPPGGWQTAFKQMGMHLLLLHYQNIMFSVSGKWSKRYGLLIEVQRDLQKAKGVNLINEVSRPDRPW